MPSEVAIGEAPARSILQTISLIASFCGFAKAKELMASGCSASIQEKKIIVPLHVT